MKKLLVAAVTVALVGAVQAELIDRDWTSKAIYATAAVAPQDIGSVDSWVVEIQNVTDSTSQLVNPMYAGSPFAGGYYFDAFQFIDTEMDTVVAVLYNAPTVGEATWFSASAPLQLPDIEGIPPIGATDITFDFSGSEWVAVPEPATLGLMGIAGLGLFLARKKARC